MWAMWDFGLWGRGTQREEEEQRNQRKEASSREEESLRKNQRQAKGSSEGNHNNTMTNTVKTNTTKRTAVCSDANHLVRRSKKPRRETTKGEEAGVSNPGGVPVTQKADEDDEAQQEELNRSLFQPCSEGDAVADARIRKLEEELHILEQELKNEDHLVWKEDEKLHADAVHKPTREATARASGTYRAR
jgi:hypothetical protein